MAWQGMQHKNKPSLRYKLFLVKVRIMRMVLRATGKLTF